MTMSAPKPEPYYLLNGPIEINGIVTGAADLGQRHPPFPIVLALVTGGAVQCGLTVKLGVYVLLLSSRVSARTRMGITAPVLRLKTLWPRTRSIDAISPLWDVMLMYVLLSCEK